MDDIALLQSKYKVSSETEAFLKQHWIKDNENVKNGDKSKVDDENCNNKDTKGDELHNQAAIKTFSVPSATSQGGVQIEVIRPDVLARRPGILVHFHSGGTEGSNPGTPQDVCKLLSRDLKCLVVNVDYRQGPEHKFPAMFDDGKAVVRWILMNKALIGGENDSKVGVLGSSVGGGVAATCAFEVPGLDFQVLLYPLVDWRCDDPSHEEFNFPGTDFSFSQTTKKIVTSSVRGPSDRSHPRASPVMQEKFSCLPPTLLFIAEIDHLKHSNYEFKCKLKAGVLDCESKLMRGAMHGFFSLPDSFPEAHQRAREIIGQFYKKHGVS